MLAGVWSRLRTVPLVVARSESLGYVCWAAQVDMVVTTDPPGGPAEQSELLGLQWNREDGWAFAAKAAAPRGT